MIVNTYAATAWTPLIEMPLVLGAGIAGLAGHPELTVAAIILDLWWRGFVLRCPRCRAASWTRRFIKGRRGFFNQYQGLTPPQDCSICGLDLTQHGLGERLPWNGERATNKPFR